MPGPCEDQQEISTNRAKKRAISAIYVQRLFPPSLLPTGESFTSIPFSFCSKLGSSACPGSDLELVALFLVGPSAVPTSDSEENSMGDE